MAEMIERVAKLFEAGDYPDKGVSFGEADIQALVDSFESEVPVKIQHTDTAFDGMLGAVRSVWRRGKELMGRVAFAPDTWSLIDRCGARRLSVGLSYDPLALREVSIVDNPRVATAQVFADCITFSGTVEFGWGGLASHDVLTRVEERLNPKTLDENGYPVYLEPYGWVEAMYEDSVVVCRAGRWYQHSLAVTDGEVELGPPAEVVRDWQPVSGGGGSNPASYSYSTRTEENNMAEITQPAVLTMSAEELDAKLALAREEAKAEAEASFAAERDRERAAAAASDTVAAWLRDGRISEAQAEFARTLAVSDASEVFAQFMDAAQAREEQPASTPPAEGAPADKSLKLWSALGVTPESVARVEGSV